MSGKKGRSGRKGEPVELKLVKGTYREDRDGPRPAPKKPSDKPSCPAHLSKAAKKYWRQIVGELDQMNLLVKVDRTALEVHCETYARYLQATEEMNKLPLVVLTKNKFPVQNPYLPIVNKCVEQLQKQLLEFGMTPASRIKGGGGTGAGEEDPFSEFYG